MSVKVDQALVDHFIDGGFGLPIKHENASYKPKAGNAFVSLKVMENDTLSRGVCEENDVTGVFQFILRYPQGKGAMPAKKKADEVFDHFPIQSDIEYDGQKVRITGHAAPNAHPEDGWFKLVRRINFRAFTPQ